MSQRPLLPRHIEAPVSASSRDEERRETSPGSSTTSRKRGPLVTAACNACRKRKVKCDGHKPQCSNCSKRSIACTYDETSKVERLRVVQERLKEAHDAIDSLREHIETLTKGSRDPHQRASLQHAGGEADRIKTAVSQIGSEIPARPSDTETQHPEGASPSQVRKQEDISEENFPHSGSEMGESITITIPHANTRLYTQEVMNSLANPFDNYSANSNGFLRIIQEETQTSLYTALHHMLPLNYVSTDELSKPCVLQQLRCRECLAEGMTVEDVMGPELLDLSSLIAHEPLRNVHAFTNWVISYVDAFSGSHALDWPFRIATIYCTFYTFRWLIYPSAQHYAYVPDFMKSTPLQLFVPHTFWINFVTLPAVRDQYALRPHTDHLRQWSRAFLSAKINWTNPDILSMISINTTSGACNITPEFEAVIRKLENWYFEL